RSGAGRSPVRSRCHRTPLPYQQYVITVQSRGTGQGNPVAADADVEAAPGIFTDCNHTTDADNDQAPVRRQPTPCQSGIQRTVVGSHQGDFLPGIAEVIGTEHVATQAPGNHATWFACGGYAKPGAVIR